MLGCSVVCYADNSAARVIAQSSEGLALLSLTGMLCMKDVGVILVVV